MAKALLGYMNGTIDPRVTSRLTAENRRLRLQVEDLEALVLRLTVENDSLASAAQEQLLTLDSMQPA